MALNAIESSKMLSRRLPKASRRESSLNQTEALNLLASWIVLELLKPRAGVGSFMRRAEFTIRLPLTALFIAVDALSASLLVRLLLYFLDK